MSKDNNLSIGLSQQQTQQQTQQQRQQLTAQMWQIVQIQEMTLPELEEKVRSEVNDNPALEFDSSDETDGFSSNADVDGGREEGSEAGEDYESQRDNEDRQDALNEALDRIGGDDLMPEERSGQQREHSEMFEGANYMVRESFFDTMMEQVRELDVTDTERQILEFLIGSLDDNGFLRRSASDLCDELAIYNSLYVEEEEVEQMMQRLKTLDPPGIGASSLQECLLLQLARKQKTPLTELVTKILTNHYDLFINKRWDKLRAEMNLTADEFEEAQKMVRTLNPKPGSALQETVGTGASTITPDFVVAHDEQGETALSINSGNIPQLTISPDFIEMMDSYRSSEGLLGKKEKEAFNYMRDKVAKAQFFISLIQQHQQTLLRIMSAIVKVQKKYFEDGDESQIVPMTLQNVADISGYDVSTISRTTRARYADTPWGIIPLRSLFSQGVTSANGEETSSKSIKAAMKELIDNEDKHAPLSDEKIVQALKQQGITVSRRAITKYRLKMNIPTARMRKE